MAWDKTVPVSGTRIVDIPAVHGANWTAIYNTWALEHYPWTSVASGGHIPGVAGLVGSISSSALPVGPEEGCVVLDDASSGVGWVYSGGKWQMPSSGFSTVRVHAYLSTDQTVTARVSATVGFDTKVVDSMTSFNTTTFLCTIPADGYYLVNVVLGIVPDVPGTGVTTQIQHLDTSGALLYQEENTRGTLSTDEHTIGVQAVLKALSGEKFKIVFSHSSTSMAIKGGAAHSFLDIYRVS
jgi:hypothetical protein